MYGKIISVIFSILFLTPAIAGAQVSAQCPAGPAVTMSVTSEITSSVPSASIGFHVIFDNQNPAPVYNAAIAVDVTQKSTGETVDRFLAPQRIALLPGNPGKSDFIWKIPTNLPSGEYTVRATLVPPESPLAELFSGAIAPSATTGIVVTDGGLTGASVAGVTVNGRPYQPHTVVGISQGSVQVVAVSGNGGGAPYKGTLHWRLFASDATSTANPLDERSQAVELHPETSTDIRYVLSDSARDGYYLEGELTDGKTTHYIDILLARSDAVFAWTKCIPSAGGTGGTNTALIVSVVATLIAAGVIWEILKRRHA